MASEMCPVADNDDDDDADCHRVAGDDRTGANPRLISTRQTRRTFFLFSLRERSLDTADTRQTRETGRSPLAGRRRDHRNPTRSYRNRSGDRSGGRHARYPKTWGWSSPNCRVAASSADHVRTTRTRDRLRSETGIRTPTPSAKTLYWRNAFIVRWNRQHLTYSRRPSRIPSVSTN